MNTVKYLPALNDIARAKELIKRSVPPESILLVGEYGRLNPLSLAGDLKKIHSGRIFLELISKNKNRDLLLSYLVSAPAAGFDGVIIAAGKLIRETYMARPVYDLDPAQTLRVAADLKRKGDLPAAFQIAIRSASGDGESAVYERARWYLDHGAEFLASGGAPVNGLGERTLLIEEIAEP